MTSPRFTLCIVMAIVVLMNGFNVTSLYATESGVGKYVSVDWIKGIGKYRLGAKLSDFPPSDLRIIDPKAKGVLLRVSPYGDNYLVRDVSGLTWGSVPLSGLILTFYNGTLIDLQIALQGDKIDFYLTERAFKEKYGPCETKNFPMETWNGDRVQVSLMLVDAAITDEPSLQTPAQGKLEFFDAALWKKFDAARTADLNQKLDKTYQEASAKVKSNL